VEHNSTFAHPIAGLIIHVGGLGSFASMIAVTYGSNTQLS